jgi:hypothetical protein
MFNNQYSNFSTQSIIKNRKLHLFKSLQTFNLHYFLPTLSSDFSEEVEKVFLLEYFIFCNFFYAKKRRKGKCFAFCELRNQLINQSTIQPFKQFSTTFNFYNVLFTSTSSNASTISPILMSL